MRQVRTRSCLALAAAAAGGTILATTTTGVGIAAPSSNGAATPIQHVVIIYGENISFDHYFGTYPTAANSDGQPFTATAATPTPNNLVSPTDLLHGNPNGVDPRRYGYRANDLLTCDQDHGYTDEQNAFDNGAMDKFPQSVGNGSKSSPTGQPCAKGDVMDYYDGNVVTALWNYAQHYAMSDNSYSTTFGPSSPGAINLVAGDTGGVDVGHQDSSGSCGTPLACGDIVSDGQGGYSLISDAQPYWDDCSTRDAVAMTGANIGDVLNAHGLSWGWFEGGFRPTTPYSTAAPGQSTATFIPDQFKGKFFDKTQHQSDQGICNAATPIGAGLPAPMTGTGQYGYKDDYIPHHEPFQYYASTANPHHLTLADAGETLANIGTDTQHYVNGDPQFDTPNHQYDMSDFDNLVAAITRGDLPPAALPAVSFLKAAGYEDGHAAYSDPIDEQEFVVKEINALQQSPDWKSTAIVIAYDDSDGWYDHQQASFINPSNTAADAAYCTAAAGTPLGGEQGRCGYGPRQPLLVISPYAKSNAVDHTQTDQSSIIKFVEDNWGLGSVDSDSYDNVAGSLSGMFSFPAPKSHGEPYPYGQAPNKGRFLLDPVTGQPTG